MCHLTHRSTDPVELVLVSESLSEPAVLERDLTAAAAAAGAGDGDGDGDGDGASVSSSSILYVLARLLSEGLEGRRLRPPYGTARHKTQHGTHVPH
jgi:hypothetical protein